VIRTSFFFSSFLGFSFFSTDTTSSFFRFSIQLFFHPESLVPRFQRILRFQHSFAFTSAPTRIPIASRFRKKPTI
jgi:hypothetical protein